jgi:hypothetical protein
MGLKTAEVVQTNLPKPLRSDGLLQVIEKIQ